MLMMDSIKRRLALWRSDSPSPDESATFDRATNLHRLREETFDVLVIGGGVTGCGAALDAAARGYRVGLVEAADFASGTSSKSSKLIHGGLRYLQQGEVGLVYEALAERQILLDNAPHLVEKLPFLIPILTKGGVMPRRVARALGGAMWGYDLTGGLRIGKRHRRVDSAEASALMPTLRPDRLASGYLYYDARTDDARLTLTLAQTAVDYGSAVANRTRVVGLTKSSNGQVAGVTVEADGERFDIATRGVINATGVWADDVRELDEGGEVDTIRPAKGVHITVPWSLIRNEVAAVITVPGDKRSIFVIPWGELAYVGTTDTDYDGPIDNPTCTGEDVDYLLSALNHAMDTDLGRDVVVGTWAGLRPLVSSGETGRTADLSRRHSVHRSESGVVSIAGGKLTTYRRMAADAIDELEQGFSELRPSKTKKLRLHGATDSAPEGHLEGRFGTFSVDVADLVAQDGSLGEPIVDSLSYVRAEVVYAVRHEMALTVDDVLARRTRARLMDMDGSAAAAEDVAELIGTELGWTAAEVQSAAEEYRESIDAERAAAGLIARDVVAR
jgi:glycerol-3-phosphate dehydrogenase